MNRGKYIVIEGPEGVGKTTQLTELARRLQAAGLPVRQLREPDSQSDLTARAIRQLTQDPRYPMNTRAEVLLYNAARAQSLQVIKQSVEHGVICLVDRNYLTTLAIQYYGRGDVPDYQTINSIINFAVGGIEPDLCVVLDAPVPTLRDRLKDRYNGERFDNLDDAFLERVRAGYLWEARQRQLPVIFATEKLTDVADSIWQLVSAILAIREPSKAATTPPASVKEIIEQKKLPVPDVVAADTSSVPPTDKEPVRPADPAPEIPSQAISYLLAPSLGGLQADDTGDHRYYTPDHLKPKLKQQYRQTMDMIFDTYGTMLERLIAHLRGSSVAPEKERGRAWRLAVRAQAAECLRPVLPAATLSSARLSLPDEAIDALITDLLTQDLPEARQLAQDLQDQGHEGVPLMLEDGSLLDGNEAISLYRREASQQLRAFAHEHLPDNYATTAGAVDLVDFWPKNELSLVPDMLYDHANLSLERLEEAVAAWSYDQKSEVFQDYIGKRRSPRQRPGNALERAHYSWDLVTDYGSFLDARQYLAATDFNRQLLSPRYGYELPALIEEANLSEQFEACFDASLKLYSLLQQAGHPLEAQYATLLGHKTRWKVAYNARQAFSLLEASYDQPATIALAVKMHEKLAEVHPLIAEAMTFAALDK